MATRSSTTFDIQIDYNGNTPFSETVPVSILGNTFIGIANVDAEEYIMEENLLNEISYPIVNQAQIDAWMASQVVTAGWTVTATFVDGDTIHFQVTAPTGTGANYNGQYLAGTGNNIAVEPDVLISSGRDAIQGILIKNAGGVTVGNLVPSNFAWLTDWNKNATLDAADLPDFEIALNASIYAGCLADDATGPAGAYPAPGTFGITISGPEGQNWNGYSLEIDTGDESDIISLTPVNPEFTGFVSVGAPKMQIVII